MGIVGVGVVQVALLPQDCEVGVIVGHQASKAIGEVIDLFADVEDESIGQSPAK